MEEGGGRAEVTTEERHRDAILLALKMEEAGHAFLVHSIVGGFQKLERVRRQRINPSLKPPRECSPALTLI